MKYIVTFYEELRSEAVVEAANEDEATEIAREMYDSGELEEESMQFEAEVEVKNNEM